MKELITSGGQLCFSIFPSYLLTLISTRTISLGRVPPSTSGLCMAFVSLFGCAFSMGIGPIANIVCSEIFPMKVRARAMGLCLSVQWTYVAFLHSFFLYFDGNWVWRLMIGASGIPALVQLVSFYHSQIHFCTPIVPSIFRFFSIHSHSFSHPQIFAILLPESPCWLLKRGRSEEAVEVLRRIHEKEDVEFEMKEVCKYIFRDAL